MSDWALAAIALVCVAWLAVAAWAIWTGLARRREADAAERSNRRLTLLLDRSPAMPMLVRVDGRVEGPERLAQRLGLAEPPAFLSDLAQPDAGLSDSDLATLLSEVQGAQRTGREFSLAVSPLGSSRRLLFSGAPASRAVSPGGGTLLWVYDATDLQSEADRLRGEKTRLDRSHRALSALIDQAPFPIWHRADDGGLRLVNRAYVEAVEGASQSGVVAAGTELLDATAGEPPAAVAERARDTGRTIVRTVPATVGHERRTLQVTDVPLGESGVGGFAFDVGDREEAIASVRRFTDAQRTMLDRLSAGVIQFAPDRTLSFANQPFRRIFALETVAPGTSFERLLDAMRDAGRLPPARDFPAFKAERREWFQAREADEESWHLDDGTYLRVLPQPLPDGALLVVFEDRTEEARLAGDRDTLMQVQAATFDSLYEGVAVVSSEGRLTLWNDRYRELWGVEPEDMGEHPRLDEHVRALADRFGHPDDARAIVTLTRAAAAERTSGTHRLTLADGRALQAASVPLPDGNALLLLLDITASQRVERALRDRTRALEEGDRMKTAFVETMSYELRTPLTSIGGFAEMLSDGLAGELPPGASNYVAHIQEAVAVLANLIDNVLDLTAGIAGRLPSQTTPVDLGWLLDDLAAGADRRARAAGLTFARQLAPDLPTIGGDAARLRKAIDHLIDNAVAYTPRGGRVLLHAAADARRVRVIVSDDGPGMDPDQTARALDLFTSVDPVRQREGALGIGLPLARQVALAHGGSLTLESEPGVGTMAVLDLPL